MAIRIEPDGSMVDVFPEDTQRVRLDELQAQVGGFIEPVSPLMEREFNGYTIKTIYVNEEGLLLDLEYNLKASMIVGKHIVGNALALFQGEQEEEEDEKNNPWYGEPRPEPSEDPQWDIERGT